MLGGGREERTGFTSKETKVRAFTLFVPWPLGSCRVFFSVTRHWLGPRALSLEVLSVTGMFFGDLIMEHPQPWAV